jgi:hypothetical protein
MASSFGLLLAPDPPPRRVGAIVALAAVALCTLIIAPFIGIKLIDLLVHNLLGG